MATQITDDQLQLIASQWLLAVPGRGLIGRFQEATELKAETSVIKKWTGGSLTAHKIPGRIEVSPVTLSAGAVHGDNALYDRFSVTANLLDRQAMIPSNQIYGRLDLLVTDRNGMPKLRYRMFKTWASSFSSGGLQADGDDLLMEQVNLEMDYFDRQVIGDPISALVNLGLGG